MTWLLWSFLAFAAAIAGHALLMRVLPVGSAVVRFLAVGLPVGITLIAALAAGHGLALPLLAGALVYGLLCELYLFLFTLAANSVSLAILRRIARMPLDESRLGADYDPDAMVARRLEQLEAGGLLHREGSSYHITAKGAGLARSFARLRRIFRHESVG